MGSVHSSPESPSTPRDEFAPCWSQETQTLQPSQQVEHPPSTQRPVIHKPENQPGSSSVQPFNNANLQLMDEFEKVCPFPGAVKRKKTGSQDSAGEHTSIFYRQCTARGVVPQFKWSETRPFTCQVLIGNKTYFGEGSYGTKKEAKKSLCRQLLRDEGIAHAQQTTSKKRTSSSAGVSLSQSPNKGAQSIIDEENWVGVLQEYAQAKGSHLPRYEEVRTDGIVAHFAFKVSIDGGPLTPFTTAKYREKKTAKKAAAREAVLWLRTHGKLPAPRPTKSLRMDMSSPTSPADHTGPTQATRGINADANNTEDMTWAHRVHELVANLGFSQPSYDIIDRTGTHVTIAARFNDKDRRSETALQEDRNGYVAFAHDVRGQKAAKRECCRQLLGILEDIEWSRDAGGIV